jgi:hypothetical protein
MRPIGIKTEAIEPNGNDKEEKAVVKEGKIGQFKSWRALS